MGVNAKHFETHLQGIVGELDFVMQNNQTTRLLLRKHVCMTLATVGPLDTYFALVSPIEHRVVGKMVS